MAEEQNTQQEEQEQSQVRKRRMAKAIPISDAVKIVEDFSTDPNNKENQIRLIDAMRRFPLFMAHLMMGNYGAIFASLPRHMTARKSNDNFIAYDKALFAEMHRQLVNTEDGEGGEDVDEEEDEQDTVEEKTPKKEKKEKEKKPKTSEKEKEDDGISLNLEELVQNL